MGIWSKKHINSQTNSNNFIPSNMVRLNNPAVEAPPLAKVTPCESEIVVIGTLKVDVEGVNMNWNTVLGCVGSESTETGEEIVP